MCRRVDCPRCHKPTFVGCGAHVEQVLGNVPKAERCQCNSARASEPRPPAPPSSAGEPRGRR